jgi:hypothetical protein
MAHLDKQLEDGKSSGTRRLTCDGVLFYLKYAHSVAERDDDAARADRLARAMASVRRVRNTLQSQYATELQAKSDRVALEDDGKWCDWPTIVKAAHALVKHWRNMHRALKASDDASDGDADFDVGAEGSKGQSLAKRTSVACQAALLAVLYTAMPPARGFELRTLETKPPPVTAASLEKNWLTKDRGAIRLGRYKTVKKHGVQTVPLPTEALSRPPRSSPQGTAQGARRSRTRRRTSRSPGTRRGPVRRRCSRRACS